MEERTVEVTGTSKEKVIATKVHLLKEEDDVGEESDGKKLCDIRKLNYRLRDSVAFMNSSLATLASNLEKGDLISIYDVIKNYGTKVQDKGTKHINAILNLQ